MPLKVQKLFESRQFQLANWLLELPIEIECWGYATNCTNQRQLGKVNVNMNGQP